MIQSASTSALRAEYLRRLADKPYFAANLGTHLNLFGQHPASGWAFYLLPGSAVLELRGGSAVLCGELPGGDAGGDAREELRELMLDKAPSMLPISRLVFPDSDAEADEFYSTACTALAHGVGNCRALLHGRKPVCTVGCYEASHAECYMAAGVTDPAWRGRGLARWLIVSLANELAADRTVRFACFPELCDFYAQLGFLQIGKIQHYSTDWNIQ